MSNQHLTEQTFTNLDLPETLLRGVAEAGFEYCMPIQAATLPVVLAGRDVAGQAQTGTGKTAAFLLATFNHLIRNDAVATRSVTQPRALILAPTRELAIQIHKDAEVLGKYTGFTLGLIYGGTGYESQRKTLETGVDVLIGTPGRIIDYFKQHVFDLGAIQVMVLDEADRMFDLGFIKDIRFLLRRMPPPTERLGMLFSATLSYRVSELAYEHMNNPSLIKIESERVTAEKVTQIVYHTANEEKLPLLIGLLRRHRANRVVVFTNTKGAAERVQATLNGNGFHAAVLSGDVPQNKRQRLLGEFQSGELPILVATDVAARGLHIPDVTHVINYDLPQDAEDYVHRIGRTARAGASGAAISFACEEYAFSLLDIEAYISHKIEVGKITDDLLPEIERPKRVHSDAVRKPRGRNDRSGGGNNSRNGRERRPPRDANRDENKTTAPQPAVSKASIPPQTHPEPAAPTTNARPPAPTEKRSAAKPFLRRKQPEKPAIG